MAAITYPAGLPCPQTSTVTPAERRALSDPNRPRDARALQRDRLEFERITWPPMPIEQSEELLTWWRNDLTYGGAWFTASWPLPRGEVAAVRKFREQPKWGFIAGGFWRLSALCEVRGRGAAPERELNTILLLHMNAPMGGIHLIDECGNDGEIVENPNGPTGASFISDSPPLVGAGSMFLAPYYGPGTFYIVSGIIPVSSAYGLSGPWTIELSHVPGDYRAAIGEADLFTSREVSNPSDEGDWEFLKTSDGKLHFTVTELGDPEVVAPSAAWPAGVRSDIAVTRDDLGYLRLFINGVLLDTSATPSVATLSSARQLILGGSRWEAAVNNFADGYYDEVRISNICRYTANYTPTFPFRNP